MSDFGEIMAKIFGRLMAMALCSWVLFAAWGTIFVKFGAPTDFGFWNIFLTLILARWVYMVLTKEED